MVEKVIKHQFPDCSEAERKTAVIERMYRDDFSAEEMERIKAYFSAFHQVKQA